MTVRCFVDTNVLIYARDNRDLPKKRRATSWISALWRRQCGVVSPQVLNEYYVTATSKLNPSLDRAIARRDVGRLLRWTVVAPDASFYRLAFEIQDRYRFSWWDSLLAAAAKQGGCTHLLTEDLSNGQRIADVTVVDPFRASPDTLLTP